MAARVAGVSVAAWGVWRAFRPEWIFGLSTDDHARGHGHSGEGVIVVDVDDDEEMAFKATIGAPERVRFGREMDIAVRWREATGRTITR